MTDKQILDAIAARQVEAIKSVVAALRPLDEEVLPVSDALIQACAMNACIDLWKVRPLGEEEKPSNVISAPASALDWRTVEVHFGNKYKGRKLGELEPKDLRWWQESYQPKPWNGKISPKDKALRAALDASMHKLAAPDLEDFGEDQEF
jgi:hypothetical protein